MLSNSYATLHNKLHSALTLHYKGWVTAFLQKILTMLTSQWSDLESHGPRLETSCWFTTYSRTQIFFQSPLVSIPCLQQCTNCHKYSFLHWEEDCMSGTYLGICFKCSHMPFTLFRQAIILPADLTNEAV